MSNTAIIAAAGQGTRMGTMVAKQFVPVLGKPLLWHTIQVFDRCPLIDDVILVLPSDSPDSDRRPFQNNQDFRKLRKIVFGGASRQDSVYNGLCAVLPECEVVVVHDGVRPLVDGETIVQAIACARARGAAIAAVPSADTLKSVSGGCISGTLDRSHIWYAQTPQAFQLEILRRAFDECRKSGFQGTDEASLVEELGEPVHIVRGASTNIKVTTAADLKLVEVLLKERYDTIR